MLKRFKPIRQLLKRFKLSMDIDNFDNELLVKKITAPEDKDREDKASFCRGGRAEWPTASGSPPRRRPPSQPGGRYVWILRTS